MGLPAGRGIGGTILLLYAFLTLSGLLLGLLAGLLPERCPAAALEEWGCREPRPWERSRGRLPILILWSLFGALCALGLWGRLSRLFTVSQGIFPIWAASLLLCLLLGLLAAVDLKRRILPDIFTLPLALLGLAFAAGDLRLLLAGQREGLVFHHSPLSPLWGLLLIGGLAFLLFLMGGLGFGDVKLFSALGLLAGPAPALWLMALSFLLSGTFALLRCLLRRSKDPSLPLGPFVLLSALLLLCFITV